MSTRFERRKMKIGVQFPNESIGSDLATTRDFVQAAEGLGYSHLLAFEHILGAVHGDRSDELEVPYDEQTFFHEPLVLFGYFAALTSTIELATGVVVLPQRQTALVAKQATEVALLSNNRLRLGVGVGWNHVEYRGLNENFSNRGKRQEEQIEVLRMLWNESVVSYKGKWHEIDRAGISPRPRTMIPIWLGGFSDAAYQRAARMADGFIYSVVRPDGPDPDPKGTVNRIRTYVDEAGRDQSAFGIELLLTDALTPREFATTVEAWEDAGPTHITLHLYGLSSHGEHLNALRDYMDAIS
jgi:probable F420-dependent oxidoreductase